MAPQIKGPTAVAECLWKTCTARRIIKMDNYIEGQKIYPYSGGGKFGRCLKCDRAGLMIIEVPKPKTNKPIGWTEVPRK